MRRAVVLVGLVLLAACRADLVVDEPFEDLPRGDGERVPWEPAFRIVAAQDDPSSTFYTIELDNTRYYRESGPFARPEVRRVTEHRIGPASTLTQSPPILPPFDLTTFVDGRTYFQVDVDPAPGDTVVIDTTEPNFWVRLDMPPGFEFLPRGRAVMPLAVRALLGPYGDGGISTVGDVEVWLSAGVAQPFSVPLGLERVGFVNVQWSDFGLDVNWSREGWTSAAVGDTLVLRPELAHVWVDVRLGGEPAPTMTVDTVVQPDTRLFRDENEIRERHVLDDEPLRAIVRAGDADLSIVGLHASFFVPVRHRFSFVEGDTVVVELGSHRVGVRVEDGNGRPLRGRQVQIRPSTFDHEAPAALVTGPQGRCEFALEEDIYSVRVYGGNRTLHRDVFVDGDMEIVVVDNEVPAP